ncbi:hypothetical protein S83_056391, partial [Arachis hypogaea]
DGCCLFPVTTIEEPSCPLSPVAVDVSHQLASPLFSPLLLRQREIKSRVKRGNQTPLLLNHQIL